MTGIKDRGRLTPGLAADIAIFDPAAVGSSSCGERRFDLPGGAKRMVMPSRGVEYTIVNAVVTYAGGNMTVPAPARCCAPEPGVAPGRSDAGRRRHVPGPVVEGEAVFRMKYAVYAAVLVGALSLIADNARGETSVIQQSQSVSVSGGGSSVTINGRTISVDTAAAGRGRVIGNGEPGSEERPIAAVSAINADGAFEIAITVGPAPKLTIETDKNILPIVKTTVSNGRLDIFADRSYSVNGRIKVTMSSPDITGISASGSNRIDVGGLAGGPLSIEMNGSNSAVLAGKVAALTCRLSGSNHLTANQLASDSASVTISGSGDAAVDARQRIAAEISGSGSIAVYGNPKDRSTQVNGSGKISFVE